MQCESLYHLKKRQVAETLIRAITIEAARYTLNASSAAYFPNQNLIILADHLIFTLNFALRLFFAPHMVFAGQSILADH